MMTERSEERDPAIVALDAYFATTTYASARRQTIVDQANVLELEIALSDLTVLPEKQRASILRQFEKIRTPRDMRSDTEVLNAYVVSKLGMQRRQIAARKQARPSTYGVASEEAEPLLAALVARFSESTRGKKAALRIIRARIKAIPHPRRRS